MHNCVCMYTFSNSQSAVIFPYLKQVSVFFFFFFFLQLTFGIFHCLCPFHSLFIKYIWRLTIQCKVSVSSCFQTKQCNSTELGEKDKAFQTTGTTALHIGSNCVAVELGLPEDGNQSSLRSAVILILFKI
jgi:hypothetical protein